MLLAKALSNQTSLISSHDTICIMLNTKHPFIIYYVSVRGFGNKALGVASHEGIEFTIHGISLGWFFQGLGGSARDSGGGSGSSAESMWFKVACSSMSLHGMVGSESWMKVRGGLKRR